MKTVNKIRLHSVCLCSLLMLVFSSCTKYLDEKPSNNYVVVSTLQDIQAILDNAGAMNFGTPGSGEASAADSYLPDTVYDEVSIMDQGVYVWDFPVYGENSSGNDWGRTYHAVYQSNVVLETLQNIERTSTNKENWDSIKGSALVFRANAFLRAVWVWGKAYNKETSKVDLGIALRTTSDINIPSSRSSIQEAYEMIIQDLEESIELLPAIRDLPVRPSKAAAYGLLSRVFWSMRDYDNALKYSDLCLQLSNELLDYNLDFKLPSSTGAQNPFTTFEKEVVFSTVLGSHTWVSAHPDYSYIDTNLINMYNVNDLRIRVLFRKRPDGGMQMRGNYSMSRVELFTGISTAEMLLIRAECNARKGNLDVALADLNKLLVNRYKAGTFIPFFTTNAEEVLDLVLAERRKELVMRDLRWIDIKRLNLEGANIVLKRSVHGKEYILPPNDNRYALPLPERVISLPRMPQNPK